MKEWFYTITQSMLELGLRGTELNLFAVLYGYSQKDDGCFYGTRATLAERCGVSSRKTIDQALTSLIEKGLVKKMVMSKDGTSVICYTTCVNSTHPEQNLLTPLSKNYSPPCVKNTHIKKKDRKEISIIENSTKEKFKPPTFQEVATYARERGFRDPEGFTAYWMEYYSVANWCLSNGKKMRDWKRAVLTWEQNNKNKVFPKSNNGTFREIDENYFSEMMK